MTHGPELKGGNAGGGWCAVQRGIKEGKWDNYNSIINKIYLIYMRGKKRSTSWFFFSLSKLPASLVLYFWGPY